jgi:hypothetical protein
MIFQPYSTAHRLVHNRSACEPVGEGLRVTTANQQWAYAVEFPLQDVPPSAYKGFKIKLRARVSQGAIGLGVLTPDGTRYRHEIQIAANDEREAVELVLPKTASLGSLMLRNTASDGASRVEVEIVGCEFLSDNEDGETEIVVDPKIFRPFRPWSGWVSEGFFTDWTGIKTRVDVWAFFADFLQVFKKERHVKHDLPLTGEHVLDWAPLAQAVQLNEVIESPYGGSTGLFYQELPGGHRIVNYELWGAKGKGSLIGYSPPAGEVWKVRGAGIITDDGTALEWMLQLYIAWPGHLPNPQLLVPIARNVGLTSGTPTLALERDLVLLPGEAVSARCNGLNPDKRLGIRFSAWVLPIEALPELIK